MNEEAPIQPTRERLIAIMRRKLSERGFSGDALDAKLREILAKRELSFNIDWSQINPQ